MVRDDGGRTMLMAARVGLRVDLRYRRVGAVANRIRILRGVMRLLARGCAQVDSCGKPNESHRKDERKTAADGQLHPSRF
jgi:hypothetical protein